MPSCGRHNPIRAAPSACEPAPPGTHYRPEELGGLPRDRFLEAFRAEGAAGAARPWIGSGGYPMGHLMEPYKSGFDVFSLGRGPLGEGYRGYREGDLPVTERAWQRTICLPIWNDPAPGAVEQYVAALEKLTLNYKALL